jgi:four helix bundle protein
MRRASISVWSNLAEGSARKTNKDRVYFISIAYGSLMELLNQVVLSNDLGFIIESDYLDIRSMIEYLSRQMSAYRRFFEE